MRKEMRSWCMLKTAFRTLGTRFVPFKLDMGSHSILEVIIRVLIGIPCPKMRASRGRGRNRGSGAFHRCLRTSCLHCVGIPFRLSG
jgi:hypothetical protein